MADIVSSPQFRHQLALFSHALMEGTLDLSQFGLQGQVGAGGVDGAGRAGRGGRSRACPVGCLLHPCCAVYRRRPHGKNSSFLCCVNQSTPPRALAQGFGVLEFLKAIQRQADAEAAKKAGDQQQQQAEQQPEEQQGGGQS